MWPANPGASRILAVFILESAFQYQYFFAAVVGVMTEISPLFPFNQRHTLMIVFLGIQRLYRQAGNESRQPLLSIGIKP